MLVQFFTCVVFLLSRPACARAFVEVFEPAAFGWWLAQLAKKRGKCPIGLHKVFVIAMPCAHFQDYAPIVGKFFGSEG